MLESGASDDGAGWISSVDLVSLAHVMRSIECVLVTGLIRAASPRSHRHAAPYLLMIILGVSTSGLSKSGLRAVPGAPLGSAWPPLPSYPPPSFPSLGIILACPLSPFSRLPSLFLNLCSSVPHLRSGSGFATQHLLSPPLLLAAAPYSLLHSRSTHLLSYVLVIKMRHFSDFETFSRILQVQFFPLKTQF
jgi:hypothetical protein